MAEYIPPYLSAGGSRSFWSRSLRDFFDPPALPTDSWNESFTEAVPDHGVGRKYFLSDKFSSNFTKSVSLNEKFGKFTLWNTIFQDSGSMGR